MTCSPQALTELVTLLPPPPRVVPTGPLRYPNLWLHVDCSTRASGPECAREALRCATSVIDDLYEKQGPECSDELGRRRGLKAVQLADDCSHDHHPYELARRLPWEVEAGMVGHNVPIPVPIAYHSLGGWNNRLLSGNHSCGSNRSGFYTRGRVITSRWPDLATLKVDLGVPETR